MSIESSSDKKRPHGELSSGAATLQPSSGSKPATVSITVMVPRLPKPSFNNSSHAGNQNNDNRQDRQPDDRDRNRWARPPSYNARFDAFYKAVLGMKGAEQATFLETLRAELPACFHMNPDFPFTKDLQNQVFRLCENISLGDMGQPSYSSSSSSASSSSGGSSGVAPKDVTPIKHLNWYPHGCGYQFGMDRRMIRKHPALEQLHEWLKTNTTNGNVTRQEAVSMVPPLALHAMPHHKCLDMCAAPGSKTSQLLEIVNRSVSTNKAAIHDVCSCSVCLQERSLPGFDAEKSGLVAANDADTKRAYMLVHQCQRINSPLLLISTHQGQAFPRVVDPSTRDEKTGFFDRVLCDVPCSGDGTLRKNPEIWGKWDTNGSFGLHPLQLQIANRGLELLKEGGLVVYSTCSMSPYEDEAVVAELLRSHKGKIELVDARQYLPLFACRRGMSTWSVIDDGPAARKERDQERTGGDNSSTKRSKVEGGSSAASGSIASTTEGPKIEWIDGADGTEEEVGLRQCLTMGMVHYKSFDDVPENLSKKIRKSCFPPTPEEAAWMQLEKCMRCLPHDEDSGGFFVATFRKVVQPSTAALSMLVSSSAAGAEAGTSDMSMSIGADSSESSHKRSAMKGHVEYVMVPRENFEAMKAFYGLSSHLNREDFWFREDYSRDKGQPKKQNQGAKGSSDEEKAIYYLPPALQSLLFGDVDSRLKLVAAGIKAFERKTSSRTGAVEFQLVQEVLPYLGPHIGARRVSVSVQDICNMLEGGLVSFSTLSPSTLAALQQQPVGSIVCTYTFDARDVKLGPGSSEAELAELNKQYASYAFHVICWKGPTTTLNVRAKKKQDLDPIKEQLMALKVYREKVTAKSIAAVATLASEDKEKEVEMEMDKEKEGVEEEGLEEEEEAMEA